MVNAKKLNSYGALLNHLIIFQTQTGMKHDRLTFNMKPYSIYVLTLLCFQIIFPQTNQNERIVTIGGSVTDVVFALGVGDLVVAVDQSSTLPKIVKKLPQAGYVRAISAEGILSMNPTVVLSSSDIGPPNVVKQLEKSGVTFKIFNSPTSFNDIIDLIDEVSIFLDLQGKAKKVKEQILLDYKIIENNIKKLKKDSLSIAFFMNPSATANLNAAGEGTRANYLIEFIGGKNIFKHDFKRYNKINKETLISKDPDIIFVASTNSKDQSISIFKDDQTLKNITAVKTDKVIYLDLGYHLTFGSKFTEASLLALNLMLEND